MMHLNWYFGAKIWLLVLYGQINPDSQKGPLRWKKEMLNIYWYFCFYYKYIIGFIHMNGT